MSLSYIIDEFCQKCGYVADDNRELILKIINRAAKEVYEKTDLPGCLMEVTVLATADSLIALPSYVGELRNARAHYTWERLELNEMAARYSFQPWPEIWNKWRVVRKSSIQNCIENASLPIVLTMDEVDDVEVNVTVTGKTESANRVSETATFRAGIDTQVALTTAFTDIYKITKDVVNNYNIYVFGADEDAAELELAVIPNDRLESLYTLVDVSQLPYGGDQGTTYRYVDVLYKQPLPQLSDDGDEFICPGFDDVIVAKACEYFFATQADGSTKSLEWFAKSAQLLNQRIAHTNGATEKKLVFAPDGMLGLYPKRAYAGGYRGYRFS
jgi:hypothetical protein